MALKQEGDRDRYPVQLQGIEIEFDVQLKIMLEKEFGSSVVQVCQSDKTNDFCPEVEVEDEKTQATSKQ